MTTKVHITNFGPDDIDIFCMDRGGEVNKPALKRLVTGDSMDVYVHLYQDVYIMEVKPVASTSTTSHTKEAT